MMSPSTLRSNPLQPLTEQAAACHPQCIVRWTEMQRSHPAHDHSQFLCPYCKQPYTYIIHDCVQQSFRWESRSIMLSTGSLCLVPFGGLHAESAA